jgi:hypothetical protein
MSGQSGKGRSGAGSDASPFSLLIDLGRSVLENPDAVARVVEGLRVAADAVREIAVQRTEQERLQMNAQVEIERVHAIRDVMLSYLDRSFDERRQNFDALFTRLDVAMAQGDVDVVAKTLDAVVDLAKTSPFKDLADVAKARAALRDKSVEWEL